MTTTYETIKNLVEACELQQDTFIEEYKRTEAKMTETLSTYLQNAKVESKLNGEGTITNIEGDNIEKLLVIITFADGSVKRFSLNHIITTPRFIRLIDEDIIDTYNNVFELHTNLTRAKREFDLTAGQIQKEAQKKAEAEKKAEEKYQKLKEKSIRDFDDLVRQANKTLSAVDEFYYSLGWLATHVGTISAAIPDYLQASFESHFGMDANPYVVDSRKRTRGGFAYQWTVGMKATFKSKYLETVPRYLQTYLSSTGKAIIANTPFIWDLIDNYGFKFGKKQDIDKITSKIPAQYIASFEAGLTA